MAKNQKKIMITVGAVAALILIIVVLAVSLSSCSGSSRYDKYFTQAEDRYDHKNYLGAIDSLNKALEYKQTEEAYLLLAECYLELDDLDNAITTLYIGSYTLNSRKIDDRLEELKALKTQTDDDDDIVIGGKSFERDVTSVNLSGLGLRDSDILPLAELTNLESLTLTDNLITNLSPVAKLSGLTILNVKNNKISDLKPLASLIGLRTLFLDDNPITDMSPIYSLSGLTTLSVRGIALTKDQLEELKEKLPNCNILSDDPAAQELTLGGQRFMSDVRVLNLSGLNITDISILAECADLTTLDLGGNKISDLSPLSGLEQLSWLCLQNNRVSDLKPLTLLTHLEYLDLENNKITVITSLTGLTRLQELFLSDNQLTDFSPLSRLTLLTRLSLKNTGLKDDDLAIIQKLSALTELNLDSNDDITGNAVDDLKKALTRCTVTHSELIYELTLGGQKFRSDATEVIVSFAGVSDISGLAKFTKLKTLALTSSGVSDISALKNISTLENIDFSNIVNPSGTLNPGGNAISDLSPLSGHTALKTLALIGNKIRDLTPLSTCANLTELHLSLNTLNSIAPLSDLKNLTELSLDYTGISDISALSKLTNLTYLGLEGNSISDVSALKNLTRLKTLYIGGNGLSIETLSELQAALPGCTIYSDVDVWAR